MDYSHQSTVFTTVFVSLCGSRQCLFYVCEFVVPDLSRLLDLCPVGLFGNPSMHTVFIRCLEKLFLCLHPDNKCGQTHNVFLFVHLSHSRKTKISEKPQIGHKHPLGLKDVLISFGWSKIKVTVTSGLSHSCECNILGLP